jgi:hypothetical protein
MGIHPFQVSDLNANLFESSIIDRVGAGMASELAIVPDNINANSSRYVAFMAKWSDVTVQGAVITSPTVNSWGQTTGHNNQTNDSEPWHPQSGYFMRGLYFTGTFIPPNVAGFRNGYVGSFVSGQINLDYAHDANNTGVVDYEPIYGHGQAVWPMTADIPHQWLDPNSSPSDGSDAIVNSSSAYSRTAYMPASYGIFHIDSVGSNTLGSGAVQFHFENRPSLRMAGFNDGNGQSGIVPSWSGTSIPRGGQGATYPYPSDPLRNSAGLNSSASDNFHEYYQVTGVRKLNSRGLSFHLAKVFDNGYGAMAYPFEEDGITLGPGIVLTGGNTTIQAPYTQVNDQSEYTWAGGRDVGATITSITSSGTVVTFHANNTFSTNQIVLIQGLSSGSNNWLNGQLVTIATASSTQFTASIVHSAYGVTADYGTAVYNPDFRVREAATFIINEEYYGLVMDTKCTIWSNKASMFPLVFFDLADTWTGSTAKRIAGVASVPVYYTNATPAQQLGWQIFFLSEDGKLARYDFTQTNGVLELAGTGSFTFASNAPTVASAGEAYGALTVRSLSSPITATDIGTNGTNVLTVTTVNTLKAGDVVNITGTAESFLNNQTVTVLATGLSGTSFRANFSHANYTNGADTGTAAGYELWALYGTMTADPRTTQTGLANTARIGVNYYALGTGAWTAATFSANTGRHNGRSLREMVSPRDGRLYILCEDVSVSGSFNVSNAFGSTTNINWQVMAYDPVAATWNTSKINGTTLLQYGISGMVNTNGTSVTWVSGALFPASMSGEHIVINGVSYTVSGWSNSTSIQLVFPGAPIQSGVSYSYMNAGADGQTPSDRNDFWFYNVNGFLHDIGTGNILIQPNWTGGSLQTLNVSGTTAALANANLTLVPSSTLWTGDAYIPSNSQPLSDPVTIVHALDFATNAERTVFYLPQLNSTGSPNPGQPSIYLAPPSFNWASPTALSLLNENSYTGGGLATINSFQKDYWSVGDISTMFGNFTNRNAWTYPTQLTDNYIHFLRPTAGNLDGLAANTIYGRAMGQSLGYLPTYWKYTGGNWKMADNWNDAFTNPYTIPNANVNVPLPYGLQVQFGPLTTTSWTGGEFHTFNLCWGNTKFARNMRQSWAQFAGQTFTNLETRTVATQNAQAMYLHDTDAGNVTWTAPTSGTPNTATLTTSYLGWKTSAAWNMLDAAHAPFDASPLQMVWTPETFAPGSYLYPAAQAVTGSNPYSWTVGANTYVASSNSESAGFPSWFAFAGNPDFAWTANNFSGAPWTLEIDLGATNAQTALSYGFRPMWQQGGDQAQEFVPISWTLEGSNNNSTWTTVDTRTNIVNPSNSPMNALRGYAYTCNGTTGSYRYYRLNISSVTGAWPSISMFRLSNQVLQTAVDFSDIVFFQYGEIAAASYYYRWNRQTNWMRGLKIETSTDGGTTYTIIMEPGGTVAGGTAPLWRSHTGYALTFPRQTGVTNVRITCQHGYNVSSTQTGFGPFYLIDYGVSQATLDAARLGINSAPQGTAAVASFDQNCLGIATDVPNVSIDGGNPSLYSAMNVLEDSAVNGFWDFYPAGSFQYKVHPFFGFVFFQGAGADGTSGGQQFPAVGTNMSIYYQWGRRI